MPVLLLASRFPSSLLLLCPPFNTSRHTHADTLPAAESALLSKSEPSWVAERAQHRRQLDACSPPGRTLSFLSLAVVPTVQHKSAHACRHIACSRACTLEQIRAQLGCREGPALKTAGCLFSSWPDAFLPLSCCCAHLSTQVGTRMQTHCLQQSLHS